jgi:hypothetical protein
VPAVSPITRFRLELTPLTIFVHDAAVLAVGQTAVRKGSLALTTMGLHYEGDGKASLDGNPSFAISDSGFIARDVT